MMIIHFYKNSCQFRKGKQTSNRRCLNSRGKKAKFKFISNKKIFTHSGRGISGELESIDGLINIGNIEWLLSKGIIIDSDAKKVIENEETKTNTIIGVSIKDNY